MLLPGYAIAMGGLGEAAGQQAETTAWVAAVVGDGGSVSAGRSALVDDLIVGLKADGIWDKLDRLWLFAAENSQSALRDIVAAEAATAVNSPTFGADAGYTGNGTSSYINSNYNPSTDATNWTANSATMGVGIANNRTADAVAAVAGIFITSGCRTSFMPKFFDQVLYGINASVSANPASNGSTLGLWEVNRTGSTALDLYLDGSLFDAGSSAAAALDNGDVFILAENQGSPVQHSTDQVSVVFFGGGFDATDTANIYTHLNTYLGAL